MRNLVLDISRLVNVDEKIIRKIYDQAGLCICDAVCESLTDKNVITDIDIGIGILHIYHDTDVVKYRFEPSESLNKSVVTTVETEQSPIIKHLEDSLISKIKSVYKSFF